MKSKLFILMGSTICLAVSLGFPSATKAQGEAAEVARMYRACTDSGGRAASNYNAWVAQNGCICPGSSVGSGQVTCSGSGSGAPAAVSSIPNLTSQQQLAMQAGMLGGYMIGQGLRQLFSGPAPPPPDPARQQRELAAQQLNNSGIYLLKQKNYVGAINEFQKALAITPNDAVIVHNLAFAKQKLKDAAVAGQTSGALGQLLGSAPASAGSQISHSALPSPNASALSLVDLDSNANTVDLRGTTKDYVDPALLKNGAPQTADAQKTLQALDNVLDQGSDQNLQKQLDDFTADYLPHHPDLNRAQSPTDTRPEIQNQQMDAEQTTKAIDQAIGQNQSVDVQQTTAQAQTGNIPNIGSANPTTQQPTSQILDALRSPDFDGRTTGNAPVVSGKPNAVKTGSDVVDLRATRATVVDPARVDGSGASPSMNPSTADTALMKYQWETSIDSRYQNDPEVQQNIRDLWTAARSRDSKANEKLERILADQFKGTGQTPQQIADFFKKFEAIATGDGPTPKEWSRVSKLANDLDAGDGLRPIMRGAAVYPQPYYGQLLKDIGKAVNVKADVSYMGTGRQTEDDCVLYAIANGAHVPEGQVKAEFTNIVRHLGMDPIEERTNPGIVVTVPQRGGRGGLNSVEELLVAEKFGKVVPVPDDGYARAIASTKQPVITTIKLETGEHKVVVTGVYRTDDGKIYYSVMDSNLGPDYQNSTAYVEKSSFEEHLTTGGFIVMPSAN